MTTGSRVDISRFELAAGTVGRCEDPNRDDLGYCDLGAALRSGRSVSAWPTMDAPDPRDSHRRSVASRRRPEADVVADGGDRSAGPDQHRGGDHPTATDVARTAA